MMKKVCDVVDIVLLFKFNLLLIIVNIQAALKFTLQFIFVLL